MSKRKSEYKENGVTWKELQNMYARGKGRDKYRAETDRIKRLSFGGLNPTRGKPFPEDRILAKAVFSTVWYEGWMK